ncbi:hypothetical protein CS0771_75200 [Catellatospora sp. IY07-71]|uniref:hypothetical protein n=1 Tax=Catellatospora sp. IY07-71 TaxID=2728827 RepID=UPI001BB3F0F8|nr:hypothetical protein [Catellatospora sp. IY07-71]BCJ77976.1 hypothetical protein CS0771_75200 [Catellatospora sp. IY07-71]
MTRNPYAAPTPPSRDTPAAVTTAPAPAEPAATGVGEHGFGAVAPVTGEPTAATGPAPIGPAASGVAPAPPGGPGSAAPGQPVAGGPAGAAGAAPLPGRGVAAGLVWRGVGIALAGHALTMLLPLLAVLAFGMRSGSGPSVNSDSITFFVLGGVAAQFLLLVAALVVGIRRIVRRDGGVGAGIMIGWALGVPASLVAGIVICVMLAEAGNPY